MARTLILASASKIRLSLMQRAGLHPVVRPATVDEHALKRALQLGKVSHTDTAIKLAEAKAIQVSTEKPDAFVIGADQVLVLDDNLLSKPETKAMAISQLEALQGRTHHLISAVVTAEHGTSVWQTAETVTLDMRPLSRAFLERYVVEEWQKIRYCVGGYMIEDRGISLFRKIEGDYHAILGLPILQLCNYLENRGVYSL